MQTTPPNAPETGSRLEDRLQAYASSVAYVAGSGGSALPDDALQRTVADGLDLHRQIRSRDQQWSDRVRAGTDPFRIEDARPIGALYRGWFDASKQLLVALDRVPGGGDVSRRDELLDACRAARFPATVNLDAVVRARNRRGPVPAFLCERPWMSYAVIVEPEALAELLSEDPPPDILDCIQQRVAALADDPDGLSEPCNYPYPAGWCYPFQCEPEFYTVVFQFDPNPPTLRIIHIHRDRAGL